MTKSQGNYLNMAKAVIDVLDTHSSVWQEKLLVTKCYERLKAACNDANSTSAEQQLNDPKGHTAAKDHARTSLESRLFVTGCRLKAFAQAEENAVVESLASFSRSSLSNISLNNLLTCARSVAETCIAHVDDLEPYEVTQADVDALKEATELVDNLHAHRDATVDQRMENTSHLADTIARLRKELKRMDTLVEGYMTDEEFMTVYFNARRIHDIRGGTAPKKDE